MRIIVHIGLHKTGTTAIQGFLARNQAALLAYGILYRPIRKMTINHHPLAVMFNKGKDHAAGRAQVAGLIALAQRQGAAALLISSEMLVEGAVDSPSFLACFDGHEVEILAYVRRPDEIVASAHDQMVRDARYRRTTPVAARPLPYDPAFRMLPPWGTPPRKLTIAPYDRAQWRDGNLLADFLESLGVADPRGFDMAAKPDEANVRLVPQLTEVLRLANQQAASEERHRELVGALYGLQDRFPDLLAPGPAMTAADAAAMFAALDTTLPQLRRFFRKGFDETFLHPARAQATGPQA